jgi:hypothetical protein
MKASNTDSAWSLTAARLWRRAPVKSKDRSVLVMLRGVVPRSWRRQVRKYVSVKGEGEGEEKREGVQEGEWVVSMERP